MDILRKSYLALGIIFLTVVCLFFLSNQQTIHDLSLNLISEIIGIFITVFLIDHAIQSRDREEKIKILKNALIQFKKPTNRLMQIMAQIYKASCDNAPNDLKDNFKDLFSTEHFYLSVQYLDFKTSAPVIPKTDWAHYTSYEIKSIKDSLDKVLDKYAFVLDSELIAEIEWFKDSTFLFIMSSGEMTLNADISVNFKRDNLNILAGEQMISELKVFLNRVFDLVDTFDKKAAEKSGLHYDKGIWLDGIAPKISSSRIKL